MIPRENKLSPSLPDTQNYSRKMEERNYIPINQSLTQETQYYKDFVVMMNPERREVAMTKENYNSSTASYAAIFQGSFYNLLYIFRIYGKPSCGALVKNLENNNVYRAKLQASDQLELFPIILLNMLQDPEIHIKRFFIPAAIDEIEIYFEFGSDSCVRKAIHTMSRKTTYFTLKKVFSTRPVTPEFVIGLLEKSTRNDSNIISSSPQNSFGGKKSSKIINIHSIPTLKKSDTTEVFF